MTSEFQVKLERLRSCMSQNGWDGILLGNNDNFCWLTGGHSAFVDKGTQSAVVKMLITGGRQYVFANSSEQYRIPEEELKGMDFMLVAYPWNESEAEACAPYLSGRMIVSDNGAFGTPNRADQLQRLRYRLTEEEKQRYREIGPVCAQIVETCCREIEPGQNEYEIAGKVTGRLMAQGFQAPVCLVAADERLLKYRHPLPVGARVKGRAMIAICAQKYGLTVSMSRIVSFLPLDEITQQKYNALLAIDATYILSTAEGTRTGDIVHKARLAYEKYGYSDDFFLHHQGGALGYQTRDYCANETTDERVENGQAFSWNPTIAGVKCEDTYLIAGQTREVISQTDTWPSTIVTVEGQTVRRPLILIK